MEYRPLFDEENLRKSQKKGLKDLLHENTDNIQNFGQFITHPQEEKVNELTEKIERFEAIQSAKLMQSLESLNEVNGKMSKLEGMMNAVLIQSTSEKEKKTRVNKNAYMALGAILICFGIFQMINDFFPKKETQVVIREVKAPSPVQYATVKFVNLRTEPKTQAPKLLTLPPNIKLKFLKKYGNWVQVEFDNHAIGKTQTGWAYLENLKKLN